MSPLDPIIPRNLFCVIEGPIGVGKSTVGRNVANQLEYKFYDEPILGGIERLRKKFYADMKQYAALFQTKLFIKRFKQHQSIILDIDEHGAIQDRSIYGDKVFAYMLHDAGYITDEELEVYEELWGVFRHLLVYPDLMFFLEADTDVLLDRINGHRKREEESGITPEYLNALRDKTESLYDDMVANGVPCYKLDWNNPNVHVSDITHLIEHTAKLKSSRWAKIR